MLDVKHNEYKLTSADLKRVKDAMVELATSPEAEGKDRVAASREVRGFLDQIMKYRPASEDGTERKSKDSDVESLTKGLKIVG